MPKKKKRYKSGIYSVLIEFVSLDCGEKGTSFEPLCRKAMQYGHKLTT
jgi:hypothetical protein